MCLTVTLINNQNNNDIYNVFLISYSAGNVVIFIKKRLEELNIPQVNNRLKLFI